MESDLDVGDHHRRVHVARPALGPRAQAGWERHRALGTVLRKLELAPLLLAALTLASACGEEEKASPQAPAPTTSAAATSPPDVPPPVADTWQRIQDAIESGDYEQLQFLDRSVFLSDFGFGNDQPDPIERWKDMGPEPLETMGAILRMPHAVKETNEGTLYQWPRFDPDLKADAIEPAEREAFLSFMSEDELVNAFIPEYGYRGPRLGILADGTWWFFLSGGAP